MKWVRSADCLTSSCGRFAILPRCSDPKWAGHLCVRDNRTDTEYPATDELYAKAAARSLLRYGKLRRKSLRPFQMFKTGQRVTVSSRCAIPEYVGMGCTVVRVFWQNASGLQSSGWAYELTTDAGKTITIWERLLDCIRQNN